MNTYGIKSFGAIPTDLQIAHMNMEKKVIFNFGMNTFTNSEWGTGKELPTQFAPTAVDTDQWIETAKKAGFTLALLSVKHHEGFCLWQTKYSEQSVKNSPYLQGKGDIVRQFTDSCKKYGMKVGLYLSPWDRNSPHWGTDAYNDYYANQLVELLTGYGKLYEIWWDGAGSTEAKYDWKRWADLIHKYQPEALIFGSLGATPYTSLRWVGNERGFAGETHYASIEAAVVEKEIPKHMNVGLIGGNRYLPAEVDVSTRPGWFYHESQTKHVRSPKEMDDYWFHSVGRNAILLLGFSPNRDGLVHEIDARRAIESHARIQAMLKNDFALHASGTANTVYCEETGADNLFDGNNETFYAAKQSEKSVKIEIVLKEKARFNTLCLSEVFELGERITSFVLTDKATGDVITQGTSVGRKKFMRFPYVETQHLCLWLKGEAAPVLRGFHLYDYIPPQVETGSNEAINLMKQEGARSQVSKDEKTVELSFGGIYSFDTIEFETKEPSEYEIFAFNGSTYDLIAKGYNDGMEYHVKVDPVEGCYQIKITTTSAFYKKSVFTVYRSK